MAEKVEQTYLPLGFHESRIQRLLNFLRSRITRKQSDLEATLDAEQVKIGQQTDLFSGAYYAGPVRNPLVFRFFEISRRAVNRGVELADFLGIDEYRPLKEHISWLRQLSIKLIEVDAGEGPTVYPLVPGGLTGDRLNLALAYAGYIGDHYNEWRAIRS